MPLADMAMARVWHWLGLIHPRRGIASKNNRNLLSIAFDGQPGIDRGSSIDRRSIQSASQGRSNVGIWLALKNKILIAKVGNLAPQ